MTRVASSSNAGVRPFVAFDRAAVVALLNRDLPPQRRITVEMWVRDNAERIELTYAKDLV